MWENSTLRQHDPSRKSPKLNSNLNELKQIVFDEVEGRKMPSESVEHVTPYLDHHHHHHHEMAEPEAAQRESSFRTTT